jgi:hypothetical protein
MNHHQRAPPLAAHYPGTLTARRNAHGTGNPKEGTMD